MFDVPTPVGLCEPRPGCAVRTCPNQEKSGCGPDHASPPAASTWPRTSTPRPDDLAFILTHGWGSERPTDIPAALAGAGYPTLAHDLRGHGESGGVLEEASRADWVADLVAVIDHLHALAPDARIGLIGASFGAYLSLMAQRHA